MFDIKKRKFLELTRRADLVTEREAIDEILDGVRSVTKTVDVTNLVQSFNLSKNIER